MNQKQKDEELFEAAAHGDLRRAKEALEQGGNIEARNEHYTALTVAANWCHTDVVILLLEAGAALTTEDRAWLQRTVEAGDNNARQGLAAIDAWQAEQSRPTVKPGHTPTPLEVRAARDRAGLTQAEAARMVYSSRRQWQRWEAGENMMHPAKYRMFVEATGGDRR